MLAAGQMMAPPPPSGGNGGGPRIAEAPSDAQLTEHFEVHTAFERMSVHLWEMTSPAGTSPVRVNAPGSPFVRPIPTDGAPYPSAPLPPLRLARSARTLELPPQQLELEHLSPAFRAGLNTNTFGSLNKQWEIAKKLNSEAAPFSAETLQGPVTLRPVFTREGRLTFPPSIQSAEEQSGRSFTVQISLYEFWGLPPSVDEKLRRFQEHFWEDFFARAENTRFERSQPLMDQYAASQRFMQQTLRERYAAANEWMQNELARLIESEDFWFGDVPLYQPTFTPTFHDICPLDILDAKALQQRGQSFAGRFDPYLLPSSERNEIKDPKIYTDEVSLPPKDREPFVLPSGEEMDGIEDPGKIDPMFLTSSSQTQLAGLIGISPLNMEYGLFSCRQSIAQLWEKLQKGRKFHNHWVGELDPQEQPLVLFENALTVLNIWLSSTNGPLSNLQKELLARTLKNEFEEFQSHPNIDHCERLVNLFGLAVDVFKGKMTISSFLSLLQHAEEMREKHGKLVERVDFYQVLRRLYVRSHRTAIDTIAEVHFIETVAEAGYKIQSFTRKPTVFRADFRVDWNGNIELWEIKFISSQPHNSQIAKNIEKKLAQAKLQLEKTNHDLFRSYIKPRLYVALFLPTSLKIHHNKIQALVNTPVGIEVHWFYVDLPAKAEVIRAAPQ